MESHRTKPFSQLRLGNKGEKQISVILHIEGSEYCDLPICLSHLGCRTYQPTGTKIKPLQP